MIIITTTNTVKIFVKYFFIHISQDFQFLLFKIKLVRVPWCYSIYFDAYRRRTYNNELLFKKVIKRSFKRLKLSYFCVKINFV